MARTLPTLKALAAVRLLLAEVPEREVARRTGVARMTVRRLGAQLESGGLAFVVARRTAMRIQTFMGRELTHEELLLALVRKHASQLVKGQE